MSANSVLPGIKGYNPDDLQPWIVQVLAAMTVLAVVAVGLRMLSRYLNRQKLWWDDWLILFSMAWNLVVVGFIFAMYSAGMGIHADKVPLDSIVSMAKFLLVAEILYVWNLVWTKLSLLLMYYRIFRFPFFKRMAWAIGGLVVAWVICITFLFIFICVPVEKLWYPDLPGHCIDQVGTWIANAASTILTDLIILLLPIPQVWKLQLRTTEKVALTLAFGLGFFVVFSSAYRFTVLFTYTNSDPTYSLAPTVGWTAIEMSAGIVSACLPTLRPAMLLLARSVGLSSLLASASSLRSGGESGGAVSGGHSKRGAVEVTKGGKADEHGDFYRLEDGTESSKPTTPIDAHFRPGHGHEYRTSSGRGRDAWSGDEVPLQGIQVHKEFKTSINNSNSKA